MAVTALVALQTRVLNALLPPCALVAVADVVAARRPETEPARRLSVSQCGRGDTTYVPAESLNPPTPLATLRTAPAPAPRAAVSVNDDDERHEAAPPGQGERSSVAPRETAGRDSVTLSEAGERHWERRAEVTAEHSALEVDTQPLREVQKVSRCWFELKLQVGS